MVQRIKECKYKYEEICFQLENENKNELIFKGGIVYELPAEFPLFSIFFEE